MPSIERHESPYLQVARHLRDKIISGELREGDAVPSAREIVREWDVAMATATKALKTLKDEGIVEAKVGRGTVVSARDTHRSAHDRSLTVMRTGRVYPPGHYAKIVEAGLVTAPQRVANALQVDEGEQAIRRQRTTYDAQDNPLSMSVSWYSGELAQAAPLLTEPDRIRQGTARYVEEQTGRIHALALDRMFFRASAADENEAQQLHITFGSPVLRGRNFYRDTNGDVLEYGESVALADLEVSLEYDQEDH